MKAHNVVSIMFLCYLLLLEAACGQLTGVSEPAKINIGIVPNPHAQLALRELSGVVGSSAFQDTNTANAIVAKFAEDISKSVGGSRLGIIQQLFLNHVLATNMEQAMVSYVVMGRLATTNTEIRLAILPSLESTNMKVRRVANEWLDAADERAGCFLDMTHYEQLLRPNAPEQQVGLIHLLFHRDPGAMLIICSRTYGSVDNQSIIATNLAKLSPKITPEAESAASYFAGRTEWWAKMFIIEFLRVHPKRWDAKLLRQLESENHPLVKSALDELLVQRKWPARRGD
jgi:hypothetical protein